MYYTSDPKEFSTKSCTYPYPNAASHARKVDLLRRVDRLEFDIKPLIRRCADVMEASKRGIMLFDKVTKVINDGEFSYSLADHAEGDYRHRHAAQDVIKAHLSPEHVCIQWTYQNLIAASICHEDDREDWEMFEEEAWQGSLGRHRLYLNMHRTLATIMSDWDLESVIQHGVTN
ncbi:hypothetical protein Q5752_001305 [Cryptotrichosporon argae]